jgi:hypothetical protein
VKKSYRNVKILIWCVAILSIVGMTGCSSNSKKEGPNASGGPSTQMGQQGAPDLAAAAKTLKITEEVLMEAMGDPKQGPPDFAAIAKKLGITEAELLKALGLPEGAMPPKATN